MKMIDPISRIREEMSQNKISVTELAAAINYPYRTLQNQLGKKNAMTADVFLKVRQYLDQRNIQKISIPEFGVQRFTLIAMLMSTEISEDIANSFIAQLISIYGGNPEPLREAN